AKTGRRKTTLFTSVGQIAILAGRDPGLYAQQEDVAGGWQNFTVVVFLPADIATSLPIPASEKSSMTDWQEEQTRYAQNWDGSWAYSMSRAGRSQKGCS